MTRLLPLFLVCVFVAMAVSKPADKDNPRKRAQWKPKLSDVDHEVDGQHNFDYDHEAFLGKEEAKSFSELSPEESKEKLRIIVKKIDKDNDGFVLEQELKDWVDYVHKKYLWGDADDRWKEYNQDNDTKLTWSEYVTSSYGVKTVKEAEERPAYIDGLRRDKRRWEKADENEDTSLSLEEFLAYQHPEEFSHMKDTYIEDSMETMDKDKDGFVSVDEYIADMYPPEDREKDEEEPDWVKTEREQFGQYRDLNKDGKLDKKEVIDMLVPDDYDRADAEAQHLMYHADTNKDGKLSEDEIIGQYAIFVSSQATDYGEALTRHDEF